MKALLATLTLLPILLWAVLKIVNGIMFEKDCEGYLKRAADANTINQAKKELTIALNYMENHGLIQGYTSVMYQTPDEDVAFWYNNIKSARTELEKVTDETTPLERTNILMKLRETLLDGGKEGSTVTVPSGISIYPNNVAYVWFGGIAFILFIISCTLWVILFDEWC